MRASGAVARRVGPWLGIAVLGVDAALVVSSVLDSRRAVGPADLALPYGDRFTVMVGAVCCLGVLELGVVHVLTARWPVVQWVLSGIGAYALMWFVGFGLSCVSTRTCSARARCSCGSGTSAPSRSCWALSPG